jgi:hypothetical protein
MRDGSGSCPEADFGMSGVEHTGSIITMFSGQLLVSACYHSDTKKNSNC